MNIKESILLSAVAPLVFLPSILQASPLVSIGDDVDVFFKGSSGVRWTDNLFLSDSNEDSDTIYTVSPGFEVNFGRGLSALDLSILTSYDIIRYQDNTDLNTELFHIKALGAYSGARLSANGSVGYDQNQSPNTSGNNGGDKKLTESDITTANLHGEYILSPKFSFGAGGSYNDRHYTSGRDTADRTTYSLPADLYYELTPKMDLSVGYTYSMTDVGSSTNKYNNGSKLHNKGYDTDTHFFNVGMRGDLLPKVSGFFKIGYIVSDSDNQKYEFINSSGVVTGKGESDAGSSTGTLGLDGDLTWAATPKITGKLGFSRDFGTSDDGNGTEDTSVRGSVSYAINSYFSANGNLDYTYREYSEDGRQDDIYGAGVGLAYTPNQYWRFNTGYRYRDNDSDRANDSYTSNSVFLSASLRY